LSEAAGATPTPTPLGVIIHRSGARNLGSIVVDKDGTVWFAESGRIARILSNGDYIETSLPTTIVGYPDALGLARDGGVWLGGVATDEQHIDIFIAHMTNKGTSFHTHRVNVPGPETIVETHDGSVWFGIQGSIGRWEPSGRFKFYPLSDRVSSPRSMVIIGSDIWFVDGGPRIQEVSSSGKITEHTVPVSGAKVVALAVGLDDTLWFADAGANKIGVLTRSGVREFPAELRSRPLDIVVGADGAAWFSEPDSAALGKIDARGVLSEYSIGVIITRLASSLDSTIWMTGQNDIVAKIDRSGVITRFATFTRQSCK
jgi:virginiamycin B lyase